MVQSANLNTASGYLARVVLIVGLAMQRLLRTPSHSRRAVAARWLSRRSLLLTAGAAVVIVTLMLTLDAPTILLMPPRGTAALWPVRIVTDFGKSSYVLWVLLSVLLIVTLALARLRGRAQAMLTGFGTRVLFIFVAVAVPILAGDVLKGVIGRGRPFVGGEANPFNYSHFAWTEIYASFPSGHAITGFALAFAVSSVWPRTRLLMYSYAVLIIITRLVLLAHHPSDVIAGALIGVLGAMVVRHWFAARRLGFTIHANGKIVALDGPSAADLKKVARAVVAPYEAQSANRA
jgi:undecaprenyl-diphosphatase